MTLENKTTSTAPALSENTRSKVSKTRVITFTSGKGGVGKTSVSVNLAIALARSGSKVCLFDADMGLANVNIMLGITPAYTLEHLFTQEKTIQDIVVEGPAGLDIVPGASGFSKCVDLDSEQQQSLIDALSYLEPKYDYLIIDTSAGISSTVLHFVAAAQMAAIVITPEPTSLTDAFSLLKVLRRRGYKRLPHVVVNMAQSAVKAEKIYRRFDAAVKKYIGLRTEYLGYIWMDESIRASVTLQRPVALLPEHDPSCKSFYRLADSLDSAYSRGNVPSLSFTTYWEKVVERTTKKRAEASAAAQLEGSAGSPSACSVQKDLSQKANYDAGAKRVAGKDSHMTSEPAEQLPHAAVEEVSTNIETLDQSAEDQWIDLRVRLNRFLNSDNTTPEQVTTLLSSCIYSYGDRLGDAASDLLHGLLQVIDPSALSDEHRNLMIQNLERLRLVPEQRAENNNDSSAFIKESVESMSENRTTKPTENSESGDANLQKHRYDEREFGSQDRLVEKIRASKGKVSLEDLLESIKYASLVDS